MTLAKDIETANLGAVLKTALDAVVVMRFDGTVAGWNDVAEKTFGWSFAEVEGQRMSDRVIPQRYRDAHEAGLARYLATGEGPVIDTHIEIEALHRDGHELPVELSITRTSQFGEPVFLGFIRDISERHDAARRQDLLIGELNHRVKNLLAVVQGIAHQSIRASDSLDDFASAFAGRLSGLARVHEILTEASWASGSLRDIVDAVIAPVANDATVRIAVAGPLIRLTPKQLMGLSMILHELMTNAVKYGALSVAGGQLDIAWTRHHDDVEFTWRESGHDGVEPPQRSGFGSKMVDMCVVHDLKGKQEKIWQSQGLEYRLHFTPEAIAI